MKLVSRVSRRKNNYSHKKVFFLVCEGRVTEPSYFNFFKRNLNDDFTININKNRNKNKSDPKNLLKSMKEILRRDPIRSNDEAWIIFDKDNWPKEYIKELEEWAKQDQRYNIAMSTPCFEIWLLWHFEDASGLIKKEDINRKLNNYLNNYSNNKEVNINKISHEKIRHAITRAEKCKSGDYNNRSSDVYILVEKILK